MELVHATGMQAGYTMGMRPDGRELLVVCIKGTFTIPEDGSEPKLAEKQVPLVEADVFSGEPGLSAPVYESDYPPIKPRCDVLLNGSAHAPGGKPVKEITVGLKVGPITKSFLVTGNRVWLKTMQSISASSPKPFVKMPISYGRAFGGGDASPEDPEKIEAYLQNPVGTGYHSRLDSKFVDGKPLPNTQEIRNPIDKPDGNYLPMSFGPVGRGWQPRASLAGTYDQNWIDNTFPFLPPDFDEQYYQAAPFDQQMPYPQGGEPVLLINLTPEGRAAFRLPKSEMLVWFVRKNGEEIETKAVVDTVLIEPDERRFMLTWRASLPLRKNMFEVVQVVVGPNPKDRYQRREPGEALFPISEEDEENEDDEEVSRPEDDEMEKGE